MSQLLGHIKSHRAMAKALDKRAEMGSEFADMFRQLASCHLSAAGELEEQMREDYKADER